MKLTHFTVGLLLTLCGCSSWFHPKDTAPPPVIQAKKMPEETPPARNIGSIWSDGSTWNEFYSGKASRVVGDLVLLVPTDNFRISVAEKRHQNAVQILSSDRDNSHIVGRIAEIYPHGVYRVEGHQGISVGSHYYQAHVVAKIREQDIAPDDSASTDVLFEMKLDVDPELPANDKAVAKQEPKKSDAKVENKDNLEPPKMETSDNLEPEKIAIQEKEETPK